MEMVDRIDIKIGTKNSALLYCFAILLAKSGSMFFLIHRPFLLALITVVHVTVFLL
jgi:hypothetical protein